MTEKETEQKFQRFSYKAWKFNRLVKVTEARTPKYKRSKEYPTLPVDQIVAVDTESLHYRDKGLTTAFVILRHFDTRYESRTLVLDHADTYTMLQNKISGLPPARVKVKSWREAQNKGIDTSYKSPYHPTECDISYRDAVHQPDHQQTVIIDTHNTSEPMELVFDYLATLSFIGLEDLPMWTKQNNKRQKEDGFYRDARRKLKDVPIILMPFYNLEYDYGRLLGNNQQARRMFLARSEESIKFRVGAWEVETLFNLPTGSSPACDWLVRGYGLIFRVIMIDLWSYLKTGLDLSSKAFGLKGKYPLTEEEKRIIFDGYVEDIPDGLWQKFMEYMGEDANMTFSILLLLTSFLEEIDSHVITRYGIIPRSAPASAARIAFSMASEDVWDKPPQSVQELGAIAYAGARAFCRKPGAYRNLWVTDISSSYPYAMSLLPDPCTVKYYAIEEELDFKTDDFVSNGEITPGIIYVSGESLNSQFPVLRTHLESCDRLVYVHGKFSNIACTTYEAVVGVQLGLLRIDRVHGGILAIGDKHSSFLRTFVHEMYNLKSSSQKESPMYRLSKLLMNSLYGKLVELVRVNGIGDGDWSVARCYSIGKVNGHAPSETVLNEIIKGYVEGGTEKAYHVVEEYNTRHSHEITDVMSVGELYDTYRSNDQYKTGHYYMPFLAALITSIAQTRLLVAAYMTQAISGHTDSIFTDHDPSLELERVEAFLSEYGLGSEKDTGLGSFKVEVEGVPGIILNFNLYMLERDGKVVKEAHHGIVANKEEIPAIIKRLFKERIAAYESKKKPTRLKESFKHGKEPGVFTSSERKRTLPDNPLLVLKEDGYHWKPFNTLL